MLDLPVCSCLLWRRGPISFLINLYKQTSQVCFTTGKGFATLAAARSIIIMKVPFEINPQQDWPIAGKGFAFAILVRSIVVTKVPFEINPQRDWPIAGWKACVNPSFCKLKTWPVMDPVWRFALHYCIVQKALSVMSYQQVRHTGGKYLFVVEFLPRFYLISTLTFSYDVFHCGFILFSFLQS